MKAETFQQSAKHKCQGTKKQAENNTPHHFQKVEGEMEMEMESVPGGKYSTTQNSEHKRLTRDGEQAICQSKQKSGQPQIRTRQMKLKKPEKHGLKYE